jgi:hypothetical protein
MVRASRGRDSARRNAALNDRSRTSIQVADTRSAKARSSAGNSMRRPARVPQPFGVQRPRELVRLARRRGDEDVGLDAAEDGPRRVDAEEPHRGLQAAQPERHVDSLQRSSPHRSPRLRAAGSNSGA